MGQIENLRLFVLVVENGSISKAAGKLRIAKSAVSPRLALLEERFGADLIDRKPGHLGRHGGRARAVSTRGASGWGC